MARSRTTYDQESLVLVGVIITVIYGNFKVVCVITVYGK